MMNNTWDNVNEAAETAVKNIKEYVTSTRVGKATIDAGMLLVCARARVCVGVNVIIVFYLLLCDQHIL